MTGSAIVLDVDFSASAARYAARSATVSSGCFSGPSAAPRARAAIIAIATAAFMARPSAGPSGDGRLVGVGEADRGDPGRGAGRHHAGGLLVVEAVVGHEADAERAALQDLGVAPKAVAERRQVGQGGIAQAEGLQVAQVVGLDADPEVVLQVRIELGAGSGRPSPAARRAARPAWPAGRGPGAFPPRGPGRSG